MNSGLINAGGRMAVLSFGRAEPEETSLRLPEDLSPDEWEEIGITLGRAERNVMWWVGDWWIFGNSRFGALKSLVASDQWQGPSYQTCVNAANVCRAFGMSNRRRLLISFTHHAEVASLPDEMADAVLDKAESYGWSTREVRAEVHKLKNSAAIGAERPSETTCTTDDLHSLVEAGKKFGCIYADPPWIYENQRTRAATGNHYDGMTVEELCAMPIRRLAADDAHLHLWVTNAYLRQSFDIIDAWGFEFKTQFAWCKPQMGIGNYLRNSHELMLIAVRGKAKSFHDHSIKSWEIYDRGAHSAKPEQVRTWIERASPGPHLELFGRLQVPGWAVFGNQIARDLLFNPPERESPSAGAPVVDPQRRISLSEQDKAA